jgi:hypothetical protein
VSIYSTRLALASLSTGLTLLYTVPSNVTVVVRDVETCNLSGSEDHLILVLRSSGGGQNILVSLGPIANGYTAQWQGRVVMNAGDELLAEAGIANWNVTVSGYVFTGS